MKLQENEELTYANCNILTLCPIEFIRRIFPDAQGLIN